MRVTPNRMTASDSNATAEQLAGVVLRDYALTKKLLKLANSAYYGTFAGEVKSVSHAISLIGFEQLRITTNCLTLFSHIKDRSQSEALGNLQVRSFFTALLARHMARCAGIRNVEEAFICGMFQSLGETLVRFYFPIEFTDIQEMMDTEGCDEKAAAGSVLGIDYPALGAAVARQWRFPEDIVNAIAGLDGDAQVAAPVDAAQSLRDVSVFADHLACLLGHGESPDSRERITVLCQRFTESLKFTPPVLLAAAAAAVQKLDQYAVILGIDTVRSTWAQAARLSLESLQTELDGDGGAPPPESEQHAVAAG